MQRDLIGQLVRFLKHIYNNILCIIYFPDRSWSVSIDFCLYLMSYISTICVVQWSTCSAPSLVGMFVAEVTSHEINSVLANQEIKVIITVVHTQCMHMDITSLSVPKPIVTKYKSDFFALV